MKTRVVQHGTVTRQASGARQPRKTVRGWLRRISWIALASAVAAVLANGLGRWTEPSARPSVFQATRTALAADESETAQAPPPDSATVRGQPVEEAVDEQPFVPSHPLSEDGRIGKILDAQGLVSIKPVLHRRWTPVAGPILLQPGDWVRTDVRGANAARLRLRSESQITLGPASLLQLESARKIRLMAGTAKIAASRRTPLDVLAPDGSKTTVAETSILRVDDSTRQLVRVPRPPLWLQGFESTTANDSIGSLVVNVDGRNLPLTVGYHKVTVDIRDQIARTVIEESFVNRTDSRLEGQFYFPLPQEASISGFGMWIGSELVEADIVEKQRAREIYETILREKRDPGLLEWAGGSLFKARVFPIEAHSEERIKITYTQVLPLRNQQYRYSYALQSELLKQTPLRELSIDVKLASVVPLADVRCATHATRIDRTQHSAHVEYAAQEVTPDRDFEIVVQLERDQPAVTMIPHRRGEDGYFMLQLSPPADSAEWQRETLPDDEPIELLILADTSGSMDRTSREHQAQLVAALLGGLTPDDRINLAVCDEECQWVFEAPQAGTDQHVQAAREFLDDRVSLGWTDLDQAFASALAQSGPNTQLVYLGDGMVVTTDADPVAFAERLRRLAAGKSVACHAVALSSRYESIVLQAIAGLAGGSVRSIEGERTPQRVARELLAELTQPVLRDLQVQFTGVQTARVYPDPLPNLPTGTQQILLGRYLPTENPQQGQIVVTARLGDRPVRFRADLALPDADAGNSFIPRLWARSHLDALLQQGSSQGIQDEIIALSEEYHIITPYTSLLVLESDADRERFQVQRRFLMRDGEKFFAQGRDQANYELLQQQMRLAGNWRVGLRRQVVRELLTLGRDASQLPDARQIRYGDLNISVSGVVAPMSQSMPVSGGSWLGSRVLLDDYEFSGFGGGGSGGYGGGVGGYDGDYGGGYGDDSAEEYGADVASNRLLQLADGRFNQLGGDRGLGTDGWDLDSEDELLRADFEGQSELFAAETDDFFDADRAEVYEPMPANKPMPSQPLASFARRSRERFEELAKKQRASYQRALGGEYGGYADAVRDLSGPYPHGDLSWLINLFPQVPPPPVEPQPIVSVWPDEVRELTERLLRTDALEGVAAGYSVSSTTESFDPRWASLTGRSETETLVSQAAWATRTSSDGSQTTIRWCDRQNQGIWNQQLGLGRTRTASKADLQRSPLSISGYVLSSLERTFPRYTPTIERVSDSRTRVRLKAPGEGDYQVHVLIDTDRNVILEIRQFRDGTRQSTERFGEFVKFAGAWWASQIESRNKDGQTTSRTTLVYRELNAERFSQNLNRMLRERERVFFWTQPPIPLRDARQQIADGKADADDQMTLLVHAAQRQDWPRVQESWEAVEPRIETQPGLRWLRYAIMAQSRQREELRIQLMAQAERLARQPKSSLYLADHVRGLAGGLFEANEMLALLEVLQPVYEQQPKHVQAEKRWLQSRADYLRNTGQVTASLQVRRAQAEKFPHDMESQRRYANELAQQNSQWSDAFAWLERVLDERTEWYAWERASLQSTCVDLLRQQGRYDQMVECLEGWLEEAPSDSSLYERYLNALVGTDQEAKANRCVAEWLEQGRQPKRLDEAVAARLQAAVSFALGQSYAMYTNRLEDRWLTPLADTAEFFATHATQMHIADRIMNHWRFQQTDACRRARRSTFQRLRRETDRLPAGRLQTLVGWVIPNDPAIEAPGWRQLAKALERRWDTETDPEARQQVAAALIQVLSSRLTPGEHLRFLRRQLAEGPKRYRASHANELFDTLLRQPWSQALEDEALALLSELNDATEPVVRLLSRVAALYRWTDRMVPARYQAAMDRVAHPEQRTRSELREQQRAATAAAREGLILRLEIAERQADEAFAPWLQLERQTLQVLAGQQLPRVAEDCWEALGPEPAELDPEANAWQSLLDAVREHRRLVTLSNLVVRRTADPADADRLLDWLDRGITRTDDPREADVWRWHKFQLLVALDRPEMLERQLVAWIDVSGADPFWRRALAYLRAEQGQIAAAISLLEPLEQAGELQPADYRALASWYLVAGQRQRHERCLIENWKMAEEWQLSQWLNQRLNPWQRSDTALPSELNPDVMRVFVALFEQSSHPQNYLWQLREFYRATRDFRLLAVLPDALLGQTAGKVYPLLTGMRSTLEEIRDEATADSIVEHVDRLRSRAKTDVDHRALDLIEALVERRSSEVLNQPGPHVTRALTALQRAFDREWSEGEPRWMAGLLADLGRISQEPLAREQLRELSVLHETSPAGSVDRLFIAHAWARAAWSYAQYEQALDRLAVALAETITANDGLLPPDAQAPLDTYIDYLESRKHFAQGESVLRKRLEKPFHTQQELWLKQRLYRLYTNALEQDGTVSLGRGETLYRAVAAILWAASDAEDINHRYQIVQQLMTLYRTAHRKGIESVPRDLRRFALERLPEVLGREQSHYQSTVDRVADTVHELIGPRDGLELLIERIEHEPKWFRLSNDDGWSRHSYQLAWWRAECEQALGDLEPRLLAIVVRELKRDLRSQQSRNQNLYHRQHGNYFWEAHAADYAVAAEEVHAELKDSSVAVQYIADYLYWGLARHPRAIEILMDAHRREILDENGQAKLVDYLQQRNRFQESIPILEPLIITRPGNVHYRVELMHAYFRVGRPTDLVALLAKTDQYFHQSGRWQENVIAQLATSCRENRLFEQAVAYFEEAISVHQRSRADRGIGHGTLSDYYRQLSEAYAGLRQTDQAVDAACGAIISWGPRHDQRDQALAALVDVLEQAPDLAEYVTRLDQKVAESGLDNPLVRKSLGKVWMGKGQHLQARNQLAIAARLQPEDVEVQRLLVDCYDRLDDAEGAAAQLLTAAQLSRKHLELYRDLGQRYEQLGQPRLAERARTSIVEVQPKESESHQMLAEIRQQQDRWEDAIAHWQAVVEIRSLEPEWLVKLAEAQIHTRKWQDARKTLQRLESRGWPSRFGDVPSQARELYRRVEQGERQE